MSSEGKKIKMAYAIGRSMTDDQPDLWLTERLEWSKHLEERVLTYSPTYANRLATHAMENNPIVEAVVYVVDAISETSGRRVPPLGVHRRLSEVMGKVEPDQMPETLKVLEDGANLDAAASALLRDHLDVVLASVRATPSQHTLSGAALARVHEQVVFRAALLRHAIAILEARAAEGGHDPQFHHPATGAILSGAARRFMALTPEPVGACGKFLFFRNPIKGSEEALCCICPDGFLHFTDAKKVPATEAAAWEIVDK